MKGSIIINHNNFRKPLHHYEKYLKELDNVFDISVLVIQLINWLKRSDAYASIN